MTPAPVVSLLTDFGTTDPFVGVCKGVILSRAPGVTCVDLTHEVPPQDVRTGAILLARSVGYLPAGIHLAVVDPGVGTDRAGIAVTTARGDVLVGPDNGLLSLAAATLGGVEAVHELRAPEHRLPVVSATFHGRDVFAPAAGAVAAGTAPADLGPSRASLEEIVLPTAEVSGSTVVAEILTIDRFGNLQLAGDADSVAAAGWTPGDELTIEAGGDRAAAHYVRTFGDVAQQDVAVHLDSDGHLAVAVTGGSAARRFAVRSGAVVRLSLRDGHEPAPV